jgi:hypothetical protein
VRLWQEWRFWLTALASFVLLSLAGGLLAYWLVDTPPTYHRTDYFEFGLPRDWSCRREGTETVCRPPGQPPNDAIIIFTAKYRNEHDTLAAYRAHLERPQENQRTDGTAMLSEVLSVAERRIGNYRWIDGTHVGSEIPGYHTRYLATVTSHIGVLITFSAHSSTRERRMREFEDCIDTLRVYQTPLPTM